MEGTEIPTHNLNKNLPVCLAEQCGRDAVPRKVLSSSFKEITKNLGGRRVRSVCGDCFCHLLRLALEQQEENMPLSELNVVPRAMHFMWPEAPQPRQDTEELVLMR